MVLTMLCEQRLAQGLQNRPACTAEHSYALQRLVLEEPLPRITDSAGLWLRSALFIYHRQGL